MMKKLKNKIKAGKSFIFI